MPKFDLYAKTPAVARRTQPWNVLRILIWTLLFTSLCLWIYSLWAR